MTGAGSSSVAFVKETSFDTLPGTPTYYLPGRDVRVQELSLDNVLDRMRDPGDAEATESIAGLLDGAIAVNYAMSSDVHADVRDIVFNDAGTGFTNGHAATSSWYIGVDYLDSTTTTATAERHLRACIPLSYEIDYNDDQNEIRETLTLGYADEDLNTSLTPGSITGPSAGTTVPFHGLDVTIDSATVDRLQSATLSFDTISRYITGTDRTAIDATLAAPETTLDMAAVLNTTDYLEQAYGGSGTTTPQDTLSSVSGDLEFSESNTTVATYSLPQLKPDSYEWADVVDGETDTTDPVTYHVNGGVSIS